MIKSFRCCCPVKRQPKESKKHKSDKKFKKNGYYLTAQDHYLKVDGIYQIWTNKLSNSSINPKDSK